MYLKYLFLTVLITILLTLNTASWCQKCTNHSDFDIGWSDKFNRPGANNTVTCLAKDENGNIYLGGMFTNLAGDLRIDGIGFWNGECWRPLGDGLNGAVYDIEIGSDGVYVGGDFTNAGGIDGADYIAKWDGDSWNTVGPSLNQEVRSVKIFNDTIFVGGGFTNVEPLNTSYLAFWDGSNWNTLQGGVDDVVYSIEEMNGELFIGGSFNNAGGVDFTSHIAKWSNGSWEALDFGLNHNVFTMTPTESKLYVGGRFTNAGTDLVAANHIAIWDGDDWQNIGSSPLFDDNPIDDGGILDPPRLTVVRSIAVSGEEVYVAGELTNLNVPSPQGNVIKFEGENWVSLEDSPTSFSVFDEIVHALFIDDQDLYIGGDFLNHAGDFRSDRLVKWNGSTWINMVDGNGFSRSVTSIAVGDDNSVYVGGFFVEGFGIDGVVKWNGNEWESLGLELNSNGEVYDLKWYNGQLYVTGFFENANGSVDADYIVRWNGSSWEPLGTGLNGSGRELEVFEGNLYVGGSFTTAGGLAGTNGLAKWNGSSWESLGVSNSTAIFAIESLGTDLYVGGSFVNLNNIPNADYIAKWNGSSWQGLDAGFGLNGIVTSLAASESELFVGGEFDTADELTEINFIAKWTGTEWSRVGPSGMNSSVLALHYSDGMLYAGGRFTRANDNVVNYVAEWNGEEWNRLGSGLNNPVNSVFRLDNNLYVGGSFSGTTAELPKLTSGFAIFDLNPSAFSVENLNFEFIYGQQPEQDYRLVLDRLTDDFIVSTSEEFEFSFDSGTTFTNEVNFTSPPRTEIFIDLIIRPKASVNAGSINGSIETILNSSNSFISELNAEISKAQLTITADNKQFTYGEELPPLTLTYSGFINGEDDSEIENKPILSTSATATSDAGQYDIILTVGNDENYEIVGQNGIITLSKLLLNVNADDKTIFFGDQLPEFTFSYSGFVNGETNEVIDDEPTIGTNANQQSPSGQYDIILSGGVDNHYSFNLINGQLIIESEITSVDNEESGNFSIYPNPFGNNLRVHFKGNYPFNWEILDLQGKQVKYGRREKVEKEFIISTKSLVEGSYIFRIYNDNSIETHLISLQR